MDDERRINIRVPGKVFEAWDNKRHAEKRGWQDLGEQFFKSWFEDPLPGTVIKLSEDVSIQVEKYIDAQADPKPTPGELVANAWNLFVTKAVKEGGVPRRVPESSTPMPPTDAPLEEINDRRDRPENNTLVAAMKKIAEIANRAVDDAV